MDRNSAYSFSRIIILLIIISVVVFVPAPGFTEKNEQQIIKVGILKDFPPQYGLTAEGKPVGLAIDIIEAVARAGQFKLEYSLYDSWEMLHTALKSNEIDIIPNMGVTEAREKWASFTLPTETFPVSLFVRAGTSQVNSLADLRKQNIGAVRLNIGEKILQQNHEGNAVIFNNVNDALLALLSGNINGLVFPGPVLSQLALQARVEDKIKIVGDPLLEIKRGIAVKKGNSRLVSSLNIAIKKLIPSPEYQAIYSKWYGSKPSSWTLNRIIAIFVFFSLFGFISMFTWRYQTSKRLNRILNVTVEKLQESERNLHEVNMNLEDRVFIRTQELEQTHKELKESHQALKSSQKKMLHQEKMASIGQLAAGVAHEINNPIGFIRSNLSSLRKYSDRFRDFCDQQGDILKSACLDPAVGDQLKQLKKKMKIDFVLDDIGELVEESLDGTHRVQIIVDNLKAFSRVDNDELQVVDLNECIDGALNIIWNELKYKITLEKDYGTLPAVTCHQQQLSQVFMNLLINASHAIETKGHIKIRSWSENSKVYISISDNGNGISADHLSHIFEPFFTTKEVGKGTGLGLSMVYDAIKGHYGEINVESELGKGTTFTLWVPATY
jgi:signal transduction histidine kinase